MPAARQEQPDGAGARPEAGALAPRSVAREAKLSRRRVLASGFGLGAALLVPSFAGRPARMGLAENTESAGFLGYCPLPGAAVLSYQAARAEAGALLVEPEVRRAVNGVLQTTLHVQYGYVDIGGYHLFMRTFEGGIPGPTLRVQPGDLLRIRLVNDLPPNRDPMPMNPDVPHHFNSTNFHAHGSHVSPSGISDNILREMEPGESYDIEIAFPADHTRGSLWYHPHHHGGADIQVASGMAGALIVEGDFAGVPEIAAARERVLVLSEVVFDANRTLESFDNVWPETATRFLTVNGQRAPTIQMRPGEVQRWRIFHAGYQDDINMALDAHVLHAIAYDGISLAAVQRQDGILMAPGQRVDVLVQAGAPGTYLLQGLPYDQGYPSPAGALATIEVGGEPLTMQLPAALPGAPLKSVSDEEITGTRGITFSVDVPEFEAAAGWQEFAFKVDGQLFDPDQVGQRVRLGAVEEWTITNQHEHDHIFHIHTNPFQVTRVNGQPVDVPVWRDTVVVPRLGSITFRSRFEDFTGRYVLHCHMMNHEDLGMMEIVEVY